MKKTIRLLALLLCLCMVMSCFAACGEANEEQPDEVSTQEATEPVVIELGAFIDKKYTIVEIDRSAGTCLALLLDDENSYKNGTYTQGRTYDINTHELLTEITYTRNAKKLLTKVVHTDAKNGDTVKTEEYSYTTDGKLLSGVTRDKNRITIDSTVYTYNVDGSYTVTTTKEGKLSSIADFDNTNKAVARTDYEYKADGSYTVRSYQDGRMTQYVTITSEGNEATRAVYTYNTDGSYTVALYENGILKNSQTGTAADVVTQPSEAPTETEDKEVLDTNATITVPTEPAPTTPNASPTNKNEQPTNPTVTPTTPPTTEAPATDASGGIDMLAQSRIFRSGEYCLRGSMEEGNEIMYMTVAFTRNTMYTSMEVDFGEMMSGVSTGMTELGFLQTADGKSYMLEPNTKTYCSMDETISFAGETIDLSQEFENMDIDMSEAFIQISENAQPDKKENAILNGEQVTCFTFNTASGESVKHYVNSNGQLIRVEDYNASGNIIQMFDVENLTGNIPEYMKKIPSDFTKTGLMQMLMAMLGDDYGTTID